LQLRWMRLQLHGLQICGLQLQAAGRWAHF
jgi:hypothetical protein